MSRVAPLASNACLLLLSLGSKNWFNILTLNFPIRASSIHPISVLFSGESFISRPRCLATFALYLPCLASHLDNMNHADVKASRKRAATDPIDKVNRKSDEQFIAEHLCPRYDTNSSSWTHGCRSSYPVCPSVLSFDRQFLVVTVTYHGSHGHIPGPACYTRST